MKVKWGSLVVDGSGKLGGHVYAKNRGGSYARTKTSPLNPQTSSQTAVRNQFTELSQSWRALTQPQIAAWESAVTAFSKTDVFGDLRNPSGINLFVRLNMNILTGGGTQITAPPAPAAAPLLSAISFTAVGSTGVVSITFAPTPVGTGEALIIEATPQLSPGKNFVKNQFRIIHVAPAAEASPYVATTTYAAKFGAPITGQKMFIRCFVVNLTTGIKSLPIVASAIVS